MKNKLEETTTNDAKKQRHFATQLLDLPPELLLEIASHLPYQDICALSLSCKRVNQVLQQMNAMPDQYLWINNHSLYKVFVRNKPTFKLVYTTERISIDYPILFSEGTLLLFYSLGEYELVLVDLKKGAEIASKPVTGNPRFRGFQKISDQYFSVITDYSIIIYNVDNLEKLKKINTRNLDYPSKRIGTPSIIVFNYGCNLVIFNAFGVKKITAPTFGTKCYGLFALDDWRFLEINEKYIVIYKIKSNYILRSEKISLNTLLPANEDLPKLTPSNFSVNRLSPDIFVFYLNDAALFWSLDQKRVLYSSAANTFKICYSLSQTVCMTSELLNKLNRCFETSQQATQWCIENTKIDFWNMETLQKIKTNLPGFFNSALKITNRYTLLWDDLLRGKAVLLDVETFKWEYLNFSPIRIKKLSDFYNEF